MPKRTVLSKYGALSSDGFVPTATPIAAEETPDEKLGKLEQTLRQYRLPLEETVPFFAPLLSLASP